MMCSCSSAAFQLAVGDNVTHRAFHLMRQAAVSAGRKTVVVNRMEIFRQRLANAANRLAQCGVGCPFLAGIQLQGGGCCAVGRIMVVRIVRRQGGAGYGEGKYGQGGQDVALHVHCLQSVCRAVCQ
jgi:hypothetical protein